MLSSCQELFDSAAYYCNCRVISFALLIICLTALGGLCPNNLMFSPCTMGKAVRTSIFRCQDAQEHSIGLKVARKH